MSNDSQYPLKFTGSGAEYFRIWIVNIALSLVTLGIYSAWAKVRTQRWICGHTHLDNQAFGYHALPSKILKGRLIAMGIFSAYWLSTDFVPVMSSILALSLVIMTPWIIQNSLKFNAQNHSYRGVRFNFTGELHLIFRNFIIYPVLTLFSFGLALPYVFYKQKQYVLNQFHYGETSVNCRLVLNDFMQLYGIALFFLLIPASIAIYGYIELHNLEASGLKHVNALKHSKPFYGFALMVILLEIPLLKALFKAKLSNMVFNNSNIGPIYFISTHRFRDLCWINYSNLCLIILTFGFYIPWARVRILRYQAEHLLINSSCPLENFRGKLVEQISASGSELAEAFDLDFSIN